MVLIVYINVHMKKSVTIHLFHMRIEGHILVKNNFQASHSVAEGPDNANQSKCLVNIMFLRFIRAECITSVLSEFSFRKLQDIHVFMS